MINILDYCDYENYPPSSFNQSKPPFIRIHVGALSCPKRVVLQVEDTKENSEERPQACIFKVGDDCRQDVLALQVWPLCFHIIWLKI